jgi:prevent-host-death family protein
MREFSTVELLRDLKTVAHAAAREPVAITQHRKRRFVLMAIEDFERMKAGARDPRRAYRVEDTPPELLKLITAGLDKLLDGKDDDDGVS